MIHWLHRFVPLNGGMNWWFIGAFAVVELLAIFLPLMIQERRSRRDYMARKDALCDLWDAQIASWVKKDGHQ